VINKYGSDPGVQALLRQRESRLRASGDSSALASSLLNKAVTHTQRGEGEAAPGGGPRIRRLRRKPPRG
jgi:hypothetical protein